MDSLRRKTIQINLVRIPPQLKEIASSIPKSSPFNERHGCLLNLVTSNTDEDLMKVLFQFFDPSHYCFTFLDYQLVPTLEEFSQLLRIPILNQLPFNGTERDPNPEEIAQALHLHSSDVTTHGKLEVVSRASWQNFCLRKPKAVGIP